MASSNVNSPADESNVALTVEEGVEELLRAGAKLNGLYLIPPPTIVLANMDVLDWEEVKREAMERLIALLPTPEQRALLKALIVDAERDAADRAVEQAEDEAARFGA